MEVDGGGAEECRERYQSRQSRSGQSGQYAAVAQGQPINQACRYVRNVTIWVRNVANSFGLEGRDGRHHHPPTPLPPSLQEPSS
jgi:hypothetical protein